MTQLSKEQLIEEIERRLAVTTHYPNVEEAQLDAQIFKVALAALAAEAQEPVAWIVHARGGDQLTQDGDYVANAEGIGGIHSTPLYAAPQPVAVPDTTGKLLDILDRHTVVLGWGEKSITLSELVSYRDGSAELDACRAAALNQTRVKQTSGEPVSKPYKLPQLSDAQCLEFLSVAFRHASISGDIERLGLKMAFSAAPQDPAK